MTRLTPNPSPWQRFTDFIRLSLRDDDTDYTVGPVGRALGLLAIPMMLELERLFSSLQRPVAVVGENAAVISRNKQQEKRKKKNN